MTNLLLLALEDNVFRVVKNLTDLELLMRTVRTPINLSLEDTAKHLPIFRAYNPHPVGRHSNASSWTISATKAMTYNTLHSQLQALARRCGFPSECSLGVLKVLSLIQSHTEPFRPYDLRRLGANAIDTNHFASDAQKRQIMGHDTFSRMYVSSKLNPLIGVSRF